MSLKELARRDLMEAIERLEREPTIQNWLAVDRLAEVFLTELEDEQRLQAQQGVN